MANLLDGPILSVSLALLQVALVGIFPPLPARRSLGDAVEQDPASQEKKDLVASHKAGPKRISCEHHGIIPLPYSICIYIYNYIYTPS